MTVPTGIRKDAKIYVAGHGGMVGSAILRRLRSGGYTNLIARTRTQLDLTDQASVRRFLESERPDHIFVAAAKVGGIGANNRLRADFIYQNLMIEANLINGAYEIGVDRLVFLGSSCIYPRDCPQPIREEFLLTGSLEPTNEPYAVAKIAGAKLCESYNRQYGCRYFVPMPANIYGPGDNYQPETSHFLPALIRKVHEAKATGSKSITLWGTGTPRREVMHCDDLADACVFLFELDDAVLDDVVLGRRCPIVNVGAGRDDAIVDFARAVCRVLGFDGVIEHDLSRPDGTMRKLLDTRILDSLGWKPRIGLEEGILGAYGEFLRNRSRW